MKTRKNFRKLLSLALAVLMCLSAFSVMSFAVEDEFTYPEQLDIIKYGETAYFIDGGNTAFLYGEGETYDLPETYIDALIYLRNTSMFMTYDVNSIVVDDGITSVGSSLLGFFINVDNIYLPSTLQSIEEYAFMGDFRVKNLEIPSSVTYIGRCAFTSYYEFILNSNYLFETEEEYQAMLEEIQYSMDAERPIQAVQIFNANCVIEDNAFSTKTTIYGYVGSTAQAYAEKHGNTFVELEAISVSPNWTWEFEDEYICTEYNRLIGTDQNTGEEVILSIEPNPHYDADGDGVCDICGDKIPSMLEFFINMIRDYIEFLKSLFTFFLPF